MVERLPGREVRLVGSPGEAVEVIEASPILDDGRPLDPRVVPIQQPGLRMLVEPAKHLRHRHEDREPLADLQRAVHAHADQEDDEVVLHLCGEPAPVNATPHRANHMAILP